MSVQPGVLKVRVAGPTGPTWAPISSAGPPGPTGPAGPIGPIDILTDVDTSTTAPADGDGLAWSGTAGNWVPQGMWKSWSGTQAEYDALGTYDPQTLYCVV